LIKSATFLIVPTLELSLKNSSGFPETPKTSLRPVPTPTDTSLKSAPNNKPITIPLPKDKSFPLVNPFD
jgi:hypothetical protein